MTQQDEGRNAENHRGTATPTDGFEVLPSSDWAHHPWLSRLAHGSDHEGDPAWFLVTDDEAAQGLRQIVLQYRSEVLDWQDAIAADWGWFPGYEDAQATAVWFEPIWEFMNPHLYTNLQWRALIPHGWSCPTPEDAVTGTTVAYYSDWAARSWRCGCRRTGPCEGSSTLEEPWPIVFRCPDCQCQVGVVRAPSEDNRAYAERWLPEVSLDDLDSLATQLTDDTHPGRRRFLTGTETEVLYRPDDWFLGVDVDWLIPRLQRDPDCEDYRGTVTDLELDLEVELDEAPEPPAAE